MFSQLSMFFTAVLTATIMENALFARALSSSRIHIMRASKNFARFSACVMAMNVFSSILCYFTVRIMQRFEVDTALKSLLFLISVCMVYNILCLVLTKKYPELYAKIKNELLQAAFNSGVFGSLIVASGKGFGFAGYLGFAIGASLGLTLALLLVQMGHEYLQINGVPKLFEGLPITFLYIGIMSLAIYGLIGHQLPM